MNNKAIYTNLLAFQTFSCTGSCSKVCFILQISCELVYKAKETGSLELTFSGFLEAIIYKYLNMGT